MGPAMREIGAFEAKDRLGTLLDWVEQGEEITITRHGQPVARLVSVRAVGQAPSDQSTRVVGAFQRLRSLGQGARLGVSLAQAIESGRD